MATELGHVVNLFAEVGLVASKSAARRTVKEGGAYVNNVMMTAEDAAIGAGKLLRRGKKNLAGSRRPLVRQLRLDERRAAHQLQRTLARYTETGPPSTRAADEIASSAGTRCLRRATSFSQVPTVV